MKERTKTRRKQLFFRKPDKEDGAGVWELIKETGVLDLNSSYSYVMWCEIFSETSIVVEDKNGDTVGFISGFIHPDTPDTLFIWQVAVDESARGQGLATRMLFKLLEREQENSIRYVEATVAPSNVPSKRLFQGLAQKLDTKCLITEYFSSEHFPEEGQEDHEDELKFRIGPIEK
ncbi:diaminobutyrate acetyltransferase [Virgibacillus sp. W0430]|uniref:diaminobutyrate acetyltransferase n=1 Tax=Virgibacillus sp. W0430 TaxID=3391580 RepID=UPI003F46E87F